MEPRTFRSGGTPTDCTNCINDPRQPYRSLTGIASIAYVTHLHRSSNLVGRTFEVRASEDSGHDDDAPGAALRPAGETDRSCSGEIDDIANQVRAHGTAALPTRPGRIDDVPRARSRAIQVTITEHSSVESARSGE
jgi:hypothetical protein